MEVKLIELCCLICQIYDNNMVLKEQRLSNFKPVFTDQELIACYFFAMLSKQKQIKEIYDYIARHWRAWFPALPTYQAFSYRLNNLSVDFAVIFNSLLQKSLFATTLDLTEDSLIDSFAVMMSRGRKAKNCQIARELANFGYCSSKDVYYYGVKLHNLAIGCLKNLPLPYQVFVTPTATHDLTALKEQTLSVTIKNLFADKAYEDAELKARLAAQNVTQLTPYKPKRNETKQFNEPLWSKFVSRCKQPIESFFHWLNEKNDYQNASKVRSSTCLLVHCYGKLAFVALLPYFYS